MKALVAILLLSACGVQESAPFSTTQSGDVVISTTNDLVGITRLDGDLIVRPADGTDTIELTKLTQVDGSVRVEQLGSDRPNGFTLSLPALTKVGLDVAVTQTGSTVTLSLPALTAIDGHLIVDETATVSMSAGALTSIHGDFRVSDGGLGTIDLPALADVGGAVTMARYKGVGTGAVTLSLPSLTSITGQVQLTSGATTILDWPTLASAGGMEIIDVRVGLKLPSLATMGGALRLERSTLTEAELGALHDVAGDVAFNQVSLEGSDGLSLPALARVGGELSIEDVSSLVTIELPALTQVDTSVRIADDGQLAHVNFDGLVQLDSDLELSGCGGPVALVMPSLVHAGGSILLTDDGQASLSAPLLAELTGSLRIAGTTLSALDLPALASVGEDIKLDEVSALNPQALTMASLSAVGGDVHLVQTIGYSVLALPLLSTIGSAPGGFKQGSLVLENNDSLSSLILPSLHAVVVDVTVEGNPILNGATSTLLEVSVGGKRTICGNGDDAVCPPVAAE